MRIFAIDYFYTFLLTSCLLFAFNAVDAQITSYPYSEDFESGAGGWFIEGSNTSWELGDPNNATINNAASGNNAWVTNLDGDYISNENGWVRSPVFDLSILENPFVELSIWWDIEDNNGSIDGDGATVQTSIDGGVTWERLGTTNEPYNWFNKFYLTTLPGGAGSGWTGNGPQDFYSGSEGWLITQHSLSELAGESNVIFRIEFGSDDLSFDEGFAFDLFKVQTGPYCYAGENRSATLCYQTANVGRFEFLNNLIIGNFADSGGVWSGDLPIDENSLVDFSEQPFGSVLTFLYTVNGPNGCIDVAELTIEIAETVSAGQDVNIDFCENPEIVVLNDYLDSASMVGTWESLDGLTILENDQFDFTGLNDGDYTFQYTVVSLNDNCGIINDTSNIVLSLLEAGSNLSVGEPGQLFIECAEDFDESNLFLALQGLPDSGGEWEPSISGAGTYFYSHSSCGDMSFVEVEGDDFIWDGAIVEFEGIPLSNTGRSTLINLFNLFQENNGNTLSGGSWSGQYLCDVDDPDSDCDDGDVDFPDLPGGSYTMSYSYSALSGCGNTNTATINFNIDIAFGVGGDGLLDVCEGNTFTEQDLLNALTGSTNDSGSWLHENGESFGTFGAYTYTGDNSGETADVVVSETTPLSAGENGTLEIETGSTVTANQLSDALLGSPNAGGSWSPELAGEGTYTYTHIAGVCPESSAQVVVTEATLSVDSFNLDVLQIIPNPSKHKITIKGQEFIEISSIEIYSITGKKVKLIENNFDVINIEDLEAAMYFVYIKTDYATKVVKLIKK